MTQSESDAERLRELEESAEGVELYKTPGAERQLEEARDEAKGPDWPAIGETGASERVQFHRVHHRREQLREAMTDIEEAAARPADSDDWVSVVATAVDRLGKALDDHRYEVEGETRLLAQVLESSPRLAGEIAEIEKEHVKLGEAWEDLQGSLDSGDAPEIRRKGTSLLVQIALHRQRGADLVYEAFNVDIAAGD